MTEQGKASGEVNKRACAQFSLGETASSMRRRDKKGPIEGEQRLGVQSAVEHPVSDCSFCGYLQSPVSV